MEESALFQKLEISGIRSVEARPYSNPLDQGTELSLHIPEIDDFWNMEVEIP